MFHQSCRRCVWNSLPTRGDSFSLKPLFICGVHHLVLALPPESVVSSAPLFTQVPKTDGCRSDVTIIKSIINLQPQMPYVLINTFMLSNMMFVIDKLWLVQKYNNKTQVPQGNLHFMRFLCCVLYICFYDNEFSL